MVDVTEPPPAEVAPAPAPAPAPSPATATATPAPSLVTAAPLGKDRWGMTLGGGYTLLLPLFVFEAGYGFARRFDVALRYETVSGIFHHPQVAVRWAFLDAGPWTFGSRLGVNYSLFAVDSDQLNLTSTLYLSGEVLATRKVTTSTDVLGGFRTDFDVFEYRIVEDGKKARGTGRFDAWSVKLGARTKVNDDLSLYVIGNLRFPTETFTYRAEQFNLLPSIEVGGTFTW